MGDVQVRQSDEGAMFSVKVVPGSSRTAVAGVLGGMLKVKVAAPAQKGRANKCLIEFLAGELGVKGNRISIVSRLTSPVKQMQISDISALSLIERLQRLADSADK